MNDNAITLNNGYTIPKAGYGTYPHEGILIDRIPYAYSCGYRLFDTSDNYTNEEYVGMGLTKVDGSQKVVITKFSQPFRTHELECCFEESRNKLGGTINIYLLHWPYPWLWKEQWKRMEDLYLAHKCDAIGVCNFDLGYLKELLSVCRVKPAINQFERHPMFQQKELFYFCKDNGIAAMSYSPLARMDESLYASDGILNRIGKKYGKTESQVVLRWNVDTGSIPIPASASYQHIKENSEIYDFSLTHQEIQEINSLETGKRIRYNPRTRHSVRESLSFLKYRFTKL